MTLFRKKESINIQCTPISIWKKYKLNTLATNLKFTYGRVNLSQENLVQSKDSESLLVSILILVSKS